MNPDAVRPCAITWHEKGRWLMRPRHAVPGKVGGFLAGTALLVVLCGFLFFYRLAGRDLASSHEARAAQVARSILDEGRWALPRLLDRRPELQKPPLYYWLVAGAASLLGRPVDALAVRLPAAVAAAATVAVLGLLAARHRPLVGLTAAVCLATALHFTWLGRTGRIDMPLTLAVTAALVCYYRAYRRQAEGTVSSRGYLPAYVAIAAGVLLKGPLGAVLPLAVIGVHLASERRLAAPWRLRAWARLLQRLGVGWGLLVVLVLTVPWFVWASVRTDGEFFRVFFLKHNLERGLGTSDTLASHPWWYYGPRFLFDFLPWSPFLPAGAWLFGRRPTWRTDSEARFGLIWLLTVLGLLSCASFKRADYLLPAYPGAALFLGCCAERWLQTARRPRLLLLAGVTGLALLVLGWWGYLTFLEPGKDGALANRRFAAEIRRWAPPPSLVLFFRVEAHALAFHVGHPVDTLLEWENLDYWAGRPEMYYIVMPPDEARQWPLHLRRGQLQLVTEGVAVTGSGPGRPLVLLRTLPGAGPLVCHETIPHE